MLIQRSFTFSAIAQQFSTVSQSTTGHAEPGSMTQLAEAYRGPVQPYASALPMPYSAGDQQIGRFLR
jgi:hypothetical protein